MKKNVNSAKTSELHEKSTHPTKKTFAPILQNVPRFFPERWTLLTGSQGSSLFFIDFGCTFEHSMVYRLSLNKDMRYQKLEFGGITKKRIRGAVTWHLRFGLTRREFCYCEIVTRSRILGLN